MIVQANGIRLRVELDGPEDAEVMVMSHALATGVEMWTPQLAALTRRYRVLRYDHRGHGGSDAPASGYDFATLAEDVAGLLRSLGIARAHYVGLSLGGVVGMHLALAHPELLASLVLCNTRSEVDAGFSQAAADRAASAEQHGLASLLDYTLVRWFSPAVLAESPATVEAIRAAILRMSVPAYIAYCRDLASLSITARLPQIPVPTLVIACADDKMTPVPVLRIVQQAIPGAELLVMPRGAHFPNIEDPAAFDAAILDFCGRHPISARPG